MKSIINLFWGICLLRQSPSVVPGQGWFVALVIFANLLVSLLVSLTLADNPGAATTLLGLIAGQAVTAGLLWAVLAARDLQARFATAIAALFGCDVLITLCFGLALPFLAPLGTPIVTFAALLVLAWSITVAGFILHHAADVALSLGIGLALGMTLLGVAASEFAVST